MSTDQKVETSEVNNDKMEETPSSSKGRMDKYFSYILSKEFIIALLLGQFVSFCITSTVVANEKLFEYGGNFPTTMTLFNYILLFLVYTPINIYRKGFKGYCKMLKTRWWKYLILSLVDVEGNYFAVKAYNYTSALSVTLLDAWTTPCVVLLSLIFLKVKYHWSQYLAVIICLGGIGAVIGGDLTAGNGDFTAPNPALGDIFCLLGATFYAFSNVLEEYLVRQRPLYEVIGQMGFFGTIISAIQISILERKELADATWSAPIIGCIIAYNIAMFCLYTATPILFRISSATFFNLSILTSDFYILIFAVYLFKYNQFHSLFPVAFVGTVLGLAIFNIYPATKPKINKDDDDDQKGEKDIEAN